MTDNKGCSGESGPYDLGKGHAVVPFTLEMADLFGEVKLVLKLLFLLHLLNAIEGNHFPYVGEF